MVGPLVAPEAVNVPPPPVLPGLGEGGCSHQPAAALNNQRPWK